jgi:hypothetical protein
LTGGSQDAGVDELSESIVRPYGSKAHVGRRLEVDLSVEKRKLPSTAGTF